MDLEEHAAALPPSATAAPAQPVRPRPQRRLSTGGAVQDCGGAKRLADPPLEHSLERHGTTRACMVPPAVEGRRGQDVTARTNGITPIRRTVAGDRHDT